MFGTSAVPGAPDAPFRLILVRLTGVRSFPGATLTPVTATVTVARQRRARRDPARRPRMAAPEVRRGRRGRRAEAAAGGPHGPNAAGADRGRCGAACLAIVLASNGRRAPLREVRDRCGISRDGVSAIALKRAAESYGLRMTARRSQVVRRVDGKIDLSDPAALPVPAMIFVDHRHFAVLEGVRGRTVRVNDPAVGRIGMTGEEFLDRFSGISFLFERTADFSPGGPRLIFRMALSRLRPYLSWLAAQFAPACFAPCPSWSSRC